MELKIILNSLIDYKIYTPTPSFPCSPEFNQRFVHLMSQNPIICCCGCDPCNNCYCCLQQKIKEESK